MANQYSPQRFVDSTHKECSWCSEIKLHSEFHKDRNAPSGLTYYCISCATAKTRAHHQRTKNIEDYQRRKRNSYYKMTYGISLNDYEEILQAQRNQCAICGVALKSTGTHTHLDHDHHTGRIRGVLCTNCNRGLGHFKDNLSILEKAIEYLRNYT